MTNQELIELDREKTAQGSEWFADLGWTDPDAGAAFNVRSGGDA